VVYVVLKNFPECHCRLDTELQNVCKCHYNVCLRLCMCISFIRLNIDVTMTEVNVFLYLAVFLEWLGSRVVSVLDSGAEGPRFKSHSRRCRLTVLGKKFTPIVPLFTKQQNW